ncbi:hypothetical protein [Chachezhania antarctica]|uniref:hypothetical protein n=1 Tax=Chachezhania antarctica TaxID=2340860 RepID=UPI000EAD042A|nr:hypothetical protein [Chachezhania antarctica]
MRRRCDSTEWWVESVQMKHATHYARIYFQGETPLREVVGAPVCHAIEPALPRESSDQAAASSDTMVKMPGLFLVGMRVLADFARDGVQTVTIRFTRAFGNLESIFLPRYRTESLRDEREELAVRALVDLVHPCLELCDHTMNTIMSEEQAEIVGARAGALAQSRAELGFFAGLLRRFVAQEDDMQPLGAEHSGMNAIGWAEEQRPFSSVSHKPASGHDLLRWAEEDDETA